jgi:transcriptional regulator with XRE-family HTH domain
MTNQTDHPGPAEASVEALELVDGLCGPVSFGDLLSTFRMCDEMSQAEFADVLGASELYLRDIESGHEVVGADTAAAWAATIGYPGTVFVERALQDQLDRAGLKMNVHVEAAESQGD